MPFNCSESNFRDFLLGKVCSEGEAVESRRQSMRGLNLSSCEQHIDLCYDVYWATTTTKGEEAS
jgi:hypothetical protein